MSPEVRRGFCLLVLALVTRSFAQTTGPNSVVQDAIAATLHALDQYQVVALGEIHGGEKEHTLFRALLSDARFPPKVNDIVVEFGNAFYQPLVDHYVSGEDVPLAELRQIWRTTTQLMAWDSPVYEQFYLAVRLMNQKLPASRRVRVLLGDPPVDWTKVRKRADIDWNRDAFLYSVIDRVLAKGRKILIIAGAGRLGRNTGIQLRPGSTATSRPEVVFGGKTAMNSLDDRYPGKIFVALPYTGFGDLTPALEPRISEWPIPSIVLTNQISLGGMPFELPFHVDGVAKMPTVPLKQVADALIYYGPRRSLRRIPAPPEIYRDDRYFEELNRMHQLVSEGRGLNRAELLRDKTNDPLPNNPNR